MKTYIKQPYLSIVILFVEKDIDLIENLIKSIRKQLQFNDYEIILIDDRKEKTDHKKFDCTEEHYSSITKKQQGILVSRFNSLNYIKGKYIWFIDADDELPNKVYKENTNVDIIQFDYNTTDLTKNEINSLHNKFSKKLLRHYKKLYYYFEDGFCPSNWRHWWKTEVFRNVFTNFPFNSPKFVNDKEDEVISLGMYMNSKSVKVSKQCIYTYRDDLASWNKRRDIKDLESLEKYLKGYSNLIWYINSILPKDISKVWIEKILNDDFGIIKPLFFQDRENKKINIKDFINVCSKYINNSNIIISLVMNFYEITNEKDLLNRCKLLYSMYDKNFLNCFKLDYLVFQN